MVYIVPSALLVEYEQLYSFQQNFPRTLEALVLHLISPVGAEVLTRVLTRRLEEMDQSMDEEDRCVVSCKLLF